MKRTKMYSVVVVLLVLVLCVGVLYGCKTATAAETTAAAAAETTAAPKELVKFTYISPRSTLEVMDDYNLIVAIEMGYFKEMGLDVVLEPGPGDPFATTKFVDQGQADLGYPSPGILTASVDQGMGIICAFEMIGTQVFNFAVRSDSPINTVQDIKGQKIAYSWEGNENIINPMLVEIGIDPKEITYVPVGAEWGQAVALGKADVALCWEGLRGQWDAVGLDFKYFLGQDFSKQPSNGYSVRKSDLTDPVKKDLVAKFLRGAAMGIDFARTNPRAAAQMTYEQFPALQEQMTPELALVSMQQLHWLYTYSAREGDGYGWFPEDAWTDYLKVVNDLGQTTKLLATSDCITNEFVEYANGFDKAKVKADAEAFKLNDAWSKVEVVGDF